MVILVLVVAWLGNAAYRVHAQRVAVQIQLDDLNARLSHVQSDAGQLASASAYFQSDEYLEKQARLKLNYKLPDEQVVFVYPDKGVPASASLASASMGFSVGSWFKKLFK